jgi:hypothetical protein
MLFMEKVANSFGWKNSKKYVLRNRYRLRINELLHKCLPTSNWEVNYRIVGAENTN